MSGKMRSGKAMPKLGHAVKPALFGIAMLAGTSPALANTPCEAMASAKVAGGEITGATLVAAGKFALADSSPAQKALFATLPAFCKVNAKLKPSADSDINIELWLPVAGWNGKLAAGGNGAFSPAFAHDVMAKALLAGYAATSSDTGHSGNNADFVVGHPEKLIDFGYRAVHVNAVAAKALTADYYKAAVRAAYFLGCSTGGRQAYGEAQRYPDDFDGIVGGAPGINFTHQTGAELWTVKQARARPEGLMTPAKLGLLNDAVMKQCDGLDGVKDGILENPARCGFAPAALLCKGADADTCLTAAQVALADKIYSGPRNAQGEQIFPGLPRGTEREWAKMLMRTEPLAYGLDAFRLVVMDDPQWNFETFDIDRDIAYGDKKVGGIVNNYDPDLASFFARGGKFIGYHGWADPQTTALSSIAYYRAVVARLGDARKVDQSYRLFMVPGMSHCTGGSGTDTFDMLKAIDDWVQTGKAPDRIPAARVVDGATVRTRPLCPFPQEARYSGSGSTDAAASFTCGTVPATGAATNMSRQ